MAGRENFVYFITLASAAAYGVYCGSLGRPLIIFMCLIMIPLATTELGTDGAISGLMEEPMKAAGYNGLWVLIYTSAIMMVLTILVRWSYRCQTWAFGSFSNICSTRHCRTLSLKLRNRSYRMIFACRYTLRIWKDLSSGRPLSALYLSSVPKVVHLP